MGKNTKEQFRSTNSVEVLKENEKVIQEKKNELDGLQRRLANSGKSGKEVDDLVIGIQALIVEISHEGGDLQRFKKDPVRFEKSLNKVTKKIKTVARNIDALEKSQQTKPLSEKTPESAGPAEESLEAEVAELEPEAKTEGLEFREDENHYFDAKASLELFKALLDHHDMEMDESELSKLDSMLSTIKSLLENREYKKMEEMYDDFKNRLGGLNRRIRRLIDEDKQKKDKPVAPVESKNLPSADVKNEGVDYKKRKIEYETARDDFNALQDIITNKGENLGALERLDNELEEVVGDLRRAKSTNNQKVFDANPNLFADSMQKFEKDFVVLLGKVDNNIRAAYRAVSKRKSNEQTPSVKPTVTEKAEKPIVAKVDSKLFADGPEEVEKRLKLLLSLFDESGKKALASLSQEVVRNLGNVRSGGGSVVEFNKNMESAEKAMLRLLGAVGTSVIKEYEMRLASKEDMGPNTTQEYEIKLASKEEKERPEVVEAPVKQPEQSVASVEVVPAEPVLKEVQAIPETTPIIPVVEARKTPEKKKRILDISEKDLLEIVGEKKLQEVVREIILGNTDVAKVSLKNIFSRKDIDLDYLKNVLAKFDYTSAQFMKAWSEKLHEQSFEVIKQWVDQMSRNWLNKNITWWDKLKENPMAHVKLAAVNILPVAVLGGSIGLMLATGGASRVAKGAVVGGATGLLRGLKTKVGSIRNWFSTKKENAHKEIAVGAEKIEKEKSIPLQNDLLAQFTGENGPEMMEQLSAMLSQSLRDVTAAEVRKDYFEKVKSNAEAAIAEISEKIDVEFEAMKKSADAETAQEVQRSQTERVEVLIKKLYEDKDLEVLIRSLIDRDPKIVDKLQGLKINNIEFGKFVKEGDKDPVKKESDARKVVSVLASVVAGASIGGALAAAPELRAVLGAVAGGYLGAKYGHLKNRKEREAQFEKEFKDNIAKAEKTVAEWEENSGFIPKELSERANDLRAPLNLGMLEGDINLKLRAQNALRRIESMQINLYINQNPGIEEQPIQENKRNVGVEQLLIGLNSELEELTKKQQAIEQRILRKPDWWRVVGYGISGAVVGAGLGYGTAKIQEYRQSHQGQASDNAGEKHILHQQTMRGEVKAPSVPVAEHQAVASVEHAPVSQPTVQPGEVAPSIDGQNKIDVVTLTRKEGILNGANRLMRANTELFKHEDGKSWTADEIHKWKVDELKVLGYKFDGDKWGYPMTVHAGAKVELFTDENGQPHFKLAGNEHVTWHKNYKWTDIEPDRGVEGARSHGVSDEAAARAPRHRVVVDHEPVKVDSSLQETAVVHHDEPVVPVVVSDPESIVPLSKTTIAGESFVAEAKSGDATPTEKIATKPEATPIKSVFNLLQEQGSDIKEFGRQYGNMVESLTDNLTNRFSFRGDARDFLQDKIRQMADIGRKCEDVIINNSTSDKEGLEVTVKLLGVENLFKNGQPGWEKAFCNSIFVEKNDKEAWLAFAPDRNIKTTPVLANGGHAVRIWSSAEKKDLFLYDKDSTFRLDRAGNLLVKDGDGESLVKKKDVLKLANK